MKFLHTSIAKSTILFIVLMLLDQFSKYIIRWRSGFYICNTTLAWNIPITRCVIWPLWGIVMLALIFLLLKKRQTALPVAFIMAGAVSNMVDRARWGCVIDFIDLKFWPVFNVADICIVLGVILLVMRRKI